MGEVYVFGIEEAAAAISDVVASLGEEHARCWPS